MGLGEGPGTGVSPEAHGKPWTDLFLEGAVRRSLGGMGCLGGRACPEPGFGVEEVGGGTRVLDFGSMVGSWDWPLRK